MAIQRTERKACIKCALTVANGFPLTRIVKVSSFSVVIKLPNHERFVNSGDESGVKCTSSEETKKEFIIIILIVEFGNTVIKTLQICNDYFFQQKHK